MQQILKNHKPIVLFEQNRGVFNGTSDVINFLRSVGYDNLYELKKADDWVLKRFIPKLFKSFFEFIEVLLIGIPSDKLELKSIKCLTKSSYDMLVMTNSELNK